MKINDTFEKIAEKINGADKIIIFPHVLIDGDTFGSSVALCIAFRKMGKKAYLLIEDDVPAYLKFLDDRYTAYDETIIQEPDLCITVDCSDTGRLGIRRGKFFSGGTTINLDHHSTNNYYADLNYVDDKASATGEIVFKLLKEIKADFDKAMAEAIYSAIATDTGNFQYSNTTKDTHLIAAELFDMGIDVNNVSIELYQNIRPEKLKITAEVLKTLETVCDGKAASCYVTKQMLDQAGALADETDGIIETLRNISGVEIAVFMKELSPNEVKVGFRSKRYADVSRIAMKFSGGGHKKASGCTIIGSIEDAKRVIYEEIKKYFENCRE